RLVQGAMIAALFGALGFFNAYTGSFFDYLIGIFMVIPFVWYGYHYTLKENMIVALSSIFVVALSGLPGFIIITVSTCASGVFIGECLKRRVSAETLFAGEFIIALIDTVLTYTLFAALLGLDLMNDMKEMYQTMSQTLSTFTDISLMSWQRFQGFAPLVIILTALMQSYVILILCQALLGRFKIPFPGNFHISRFHIPLKTGIVIVLGIALCLWIQYGLKNESLLSFSILYILFFLLMIDGMALISFYMMERGVGRWTGLLFIACFIPYVMYILIVIGLIDIFGDLRSKIMYNR
ncbi:MAG: DUF2232 domain-containing protein, partial [bacterium]